MKKVLSLVLAVVMAFSCMILASCSAKTDSELVKSEGTLVVGITDFAPMDYKEDGKWVGFDAEMATLFAEKLGVKVEFVEIEWENKALELKNKSIDCVWNGMTINDEVKAAMDCSEPYCKNEQVVVLPKAKAAKYKTVEDCKALQFAVEKGSAGQEEAEANGFKVTEVLAQADALMEVKSGTSDGAVIDLLMAGAMVGEGTSYANLVKTDISLSNEEYGVGFRQGSDLVKEINAFFDECRENGKMEEIATKYGVQAAVIK